MATKIYDQISKERYEIILGRYKKYVENLNDPDKEPVRVFDPLPQKLLKELELIREVSKELQDKKDEDMRKAAADAEEDAKKAAEEEMLKKKEEAEKETETEEKKE